MSAAKRDRIVAAARGWIGTPYRHQASVNGAGADCLGLIRGVWRDVVGAEEEVPPQYSADWGETGRSELLFEAAERHLRKSDGAGQPGDVLLFRMRDKGIAKHLGLISGPNTFIHSYTGHGVIECALTEPWRRRVAAVFAFPFERI
ncbi:MAG: NlpC/P60 family protein [Pseudomonadota bacterium]